MNWNNPENLISIYLNNTNLESGVSKVLETLDINSNNIIDEYIQKYLDFKLEQKKNSTQEYKPCIQTPQTNQINFDFIGEFDKWADIKIYEDLLINLINLFRFIGSKLGPSIIKNLRFKNINQFSPNIYEFDFFTKSSVRPNFLTLLRLLVTLGCPTKILTKEFKTFLTLGHKPIGLITYPEVSKPEVSKPLLTITWNVDTVDEFFKKLYKLEELCIDQNLTTQFELAKKLYSKLKNLIIQLVLKKMLSPFISTHNINLCLQECEINLYEQIRTNFADIFVCDTFSTQNSQVYQINNFIDFSISPSADKIQTQKENLSYGYAVFTTVQTLNLTLSPQNVFNSLVLNHEKGSLKRGLTFSSRGIYIPELNLYNLHLKSQQAYNNLLSLEKFYYGIESKLESGNKIFLLNYNFSSNTYTQIFVCAKLIEKYPSLSYQQIHWIIDVLYERKMSFDQVLYELSKVSCTFNNSYSTNIVNLTQEYQDELVEKYTNIFSKIPISKFIQGINLHWTKKFERKICELVMNQAINITNNLITNPDIIIKEFCSHIGLYKQIPILDSNTTNLIICGDINMFIISSGNTRIKKYSFKSTSEEDMPFNHLLQMQMNSWANDIIFACI